MTKKFIILFFMVVLCLNIVYGYTEDFYGMTTFTSSNTGGYGYGIAIKPSVDIDLVNVTKASSNTDADRVTVWRNSTDSQITSESFSGTIAEFSAVIPLSAGNIYYIVYDYSPTGDNWNNQRNTNPLPAPPYNFTDIEAMGGIIWDEGNGFREWDLSTWYSVVEIGYNKESPPTITINNPVHNTTLTGDVTLNFSVTELINYTVDIDGNSQISGEGQYFEGIIELGNFSEGYNNITVSCSACINDSVMVFVDTITPTLDILNVTDGYSYYLPESYITGNFNLDVKGSDNNLYSMNVTFMQEENVSFYNYSENIEFSEWHVKESVLLSSFNEGAVSGHVKLEDAHTRYNIRNIPNWAIDNGRMFDYVGITTNAEDFKGFSHTKQPDKYNFSFDFNTVKTDIDVFIGSPSHKVNVYKGESLVIGMYWIDFINYDGWEITDFNRINNRIVKISLSHPTGMDYVRFNSIGVINQYNESFYFYIDKSDDTITLSDPDSILYNYSTDDIDIVRIEANYTPEFYPTSPQICELYINDTYQNFTSVISNSSENTIYGYSPLPAPLKSFSLEVYVNCSYNISKGDTTEPKRYKSNTLTFEVFNSAVSTTTTTTTTTTISDDEFRVNPDLTSSGFNSVSHGLYIIFLGFLWITFFMSIFYVRGQNNNVPKINKIICFIVGIVFGANMFGLSTLLGVLIYTVSALILWYE